MPRLGVQNRLHPNRQALTNCNADACEASKLAVVYLHSFSEMIDFVAATKIHEKARVS